MKFCQLENGKTEINVKLDKETLWLSLGHVADLFDPLKTNKKGQIIALPGPVQFDVT